MGCQILGKETQNEVKKSVAKAARKFKTAVKNALTDMGKDLKKQTKLSINNVGRTGRIYRVRIRGKIKRHQASAPGQVPANMTGALKRSVQYKVTNPVTLEYGAGDSTGPVDYAKYLEMGTSRMAPRPYLEPQIKRLKGGDASKIFKKRIDDLFI